MFIPNRDSVGDVIHKSKVTTQGWVYDQRSVVFTTSLLNSTINKKYDNSAWSDATIKFYNGSDIELNSQGTIDTDCVKTTLDWEPVFNYDLIGGELVVLGVPQGYDSTAQMWTYVIPDLSPVYGGSVNMIDGRVLRDGGRIYADGRGVKTLYYDAAYHTNKMRAIIRHGAGVKIKSEMVFEIFYGR